MAGLAEPRRNSVPKVFLTVLKLFFWRGSRVRGRSSAMTLSWARSRRAFTTCFLGLLLFFGGAAPVFSFALNGYRWPDGSQIAMHLQLEHFSGALQDGSVSWNAS